MNKTKYWAVRQKISEAILNHMEIVEHLNNPEYLEEMGIDRIPVKEVEFELKVTDVNGSEIVAQIVVEVEEN